MRRCWALQVTSRHRRVVDRAGIDCSIDSMENPDLSSSCAQRVRRPRRCVSLCGRQRLGDLDRTSESPCAWPVAYPGSTVPDDTNTDVARARTSGSWLGRAGVVGSPPLPPYLLASHRTEPQHCPLVSLSHPLASRPISRVTLRNPGVARSAIRGRPNMRSDRAPAPRD